MTKSNKGKNHNRSAILLIHCPDRKGLVATVTDFIYKNNGNILYLDQHVDYQKQMFFMRVEWDLKDFIIGSEKINEFFNSTIAEKFGMYWKIFFSDEIPRMAIFVSKLSHCLYDILSRCQSGEWQVDVPLIISNHSDLEGIAKSFGIDFHLFSINLVNKEEQERKQLALLNEYKISFIVLARYMQILTENFISHYPNKIINIHHAFLPAFPGAKPYHSAYEHGVKIIGATSHYVTAELDSGPIIEQDVVRVSHSDLVEDLVRKGRDLEKIVLSRAIWYHIQRKILVYDNRTVIFV
jgi:formyltetrahydrofolate deformylase